MFQVPQLKFQNKEGKTGGDLLPVDEKDRQHPGRENKTNRLSPSTGQHRLKHR